jgi:chitinase
VQDAGLTHLNLAFANPGAGNEPELDASDEDIALLVTSAHAAGTQVIASIGGGDESGDVAASLTPANVDDFVAKLTAYVQRHNFDGVDVDVEGSAAMTPDYNTFVQKIGAAMHANGKVLTAAFATWFVSSIPDETLATFDFINVMSYDHCGPWTGACEQATMQWAMDDLGYFAVERGIAKEKLVLGVPFYAWCWGVCNDVPAFTYAELIAQRPDAYQFDWIDEDGRQLSYNGEATIMQKVALSREYGGVMIWELGQDAVGERSLLRLITGQ